MNILTDILCDSSSLMTPLSKVMSPEEISSKQSPVQLLNSVSHISTLEKPLSSTSSPSNIHLFNPSSHISISTPMETGFDDASSYSNAFSDIVPPWLTNDFSKVSSSLPADTILSNVSDIYQSSRNVEHLDMLDLRFPPELNAPSLDSNRISENQKLLTPMNGLSMERYSSNDSLLLSSFNLINAPHLDSSETNGLEFSKLKANVHSHHNNPQELLNSVLPYGSDLLHLPMPDSNLSEPCLTTSSSPCTMSLSQSQSQSVCDKLPQINFNNLDSLLVNETELSAEIQRLRQDLPNISNQLSEEMRYDQTNIGLNGFPSMQPNPCIREALCLNRLLNTQDSSVQVSVEDLNQLLKLNDGCMSCENAKVGSTVEIVQCFKCKFCDFINTHKCAVENHIKTLHSNVTLKGFPPSTGKGGGLSITSLPIPDSTKKLEDPKKIQSLNPSLSILNCPVPTSIVSSNGLINWLIVSDDNVSSNNFNCQKCGKLFADISALNNHLSSDHSEFSSHVHNDANKIALPIKNPTQTTLNPNTSKKLVKTHTDSPINSTKQIKITRGSDHHKATPKAPKGKISDNLASGQEKNVSSQKKAWWNKLKKEIGTYICEHKSCNVRFRALDNLEYHRKCHSFGTSTFTCPECETKFENWNVIAGHLWRIHQNDMELYGCDKCSYRTYSLSRLENIHKRIHEDERQFLCDKCGKDFKNLRQLRNHKARCEKVSVLKPKKLLKCQFCSSPFPTRALLRYHLETAHNVQHKMYMCSHCDYKTHRRETFKMHMRSHTGEKPFACDMCEYRTTDHNSLRRHKMKHSGIKPYKCPYCTYSSIQSSTFKSHIQKQHPGHNGVLHSCKLCSFQTLKPEYLLSHMKEHEIQNMPRNSETVQKKTTTPLVEAIDISLSRGDSSMTHFDKNKNIQSFLNAFDAGLVSICEGVAP